MGKAERDRAPLLSRQTLSIHVVEPRLFYNRIQTPIVGEPWWYGCRSRHQNGC
jgi:hypothetical protein